ncbi:MAG: 4-(cytidine 5'-diphospho)-2-C-methyl-D-erythritol kinase [Bacilli bacterium]|jgi:4-diphosphocytidyl-2-C-methyl-D-erythritol kinase
MEREYRAYAKINLYLRIRGLLPNGYHDLDMIMVPIDLYDRITISVLPETAPRSFIYTEGHNVRESDNLAFVALNRMRAKYGFKENLAIHIEKSIPIGAGLGGGSSDAATIIRALVEIFDLPAKEEDLVALGKEIGSDVPFFLKQKPARLQGVGEEITPIEVRNKGQKVLLVKPEESLVTRDVYKAYDAAPVTEEKPDIEKLLKALESGVDHTHKKLFHNDLTSAAVRLLPAVGKIKNSLKKEGDFIVEMTGAGSAVYIISRNEIKLRYLRDKYEQKGYQTFLVDFNPEIK